MVRGKVVDGEVSRWVGRWVARCGSEATSVEDALPRSSRSCLGVAVGPTDGPPESTTADETLSWCPERRS